jgi:hypothetical protein
VSFALPARCADFTDGSARRRIDLYAGPKLLRGICVARVAHERVSLVRQQDDPFYGGRQFGIRDLNG